MNDLPADQRVAALMALPTAADLHARKIIVTQPPKRNAALVASLRIKDDAPQPRKRTSSSASSSGETSPKKEVPAATPSCGTCWLARQQGVAGERSGLIHTLFAHAALWRKLWHLWSRYFTVASSGAHRDDSPHMATLRRALEAVGIAWGERCAALVRPWDRTHRGESDEARSAPWRKDEFLSTPFIDGNVQRALCIATQSILGAEHQQSALFFFEVVVRGSIVYMHERGVRRQACTLRALEAEFQEGVQVDGAYKYVETYGFESAAKQSEEIAARQKNPATRMRTDSGAELRVTSLLNEVGRSSPAEAVEQRCCAILHHGGSVPASAADYVWPLELGNTGPLESKMQCTARGDVSFLLMPVSDEVRRRVFEETKNVEVQPAPPAPKLQTAPKKATATEIWAQAFAELGYKAEEIDDMFSDATLDATLPENMLIVK